MALQFNPLTVQALAAQMAQAAIAKGLLGVENPFAKKTEPQETAVLSAPSANIYRP